MPFPFCCSGDLEVFGELGFKVVWQRQDNGWVRWPVRLARAGEHTLLLGIGFLPRWQMHLGDGTTQLYYGQDAKDAELGAAGAD